VVAGRGPGRRAARRRALGLAGGAEAEPLEQAGGVALLVARERAEGGAEHGGVLGERGPHEGLALSVSAA
jgi:hypothetical protein